MLTIQANLRTQKKTGKSTKRLCKRNKCPAIIYGRNHTNLSIEFNQNDLQNPKIAECLYKNNTISLCINNEPTITVKIQEIQYHPFKLKIIHIDCIRI